MYSLLSRIFFPVKWQQNKSKRPQTLLHVCKRKQRPTWNLSSSLNVSFSLDLFFFSRIHSREMHLHRGLELKKRKKN